MDYYELSLQRKKEIEDGLLELMTRSPFSQITVTGLTQHLGMSRKCFYHYFSGKEACLESLIDRTIQEAALYIAAAPEAVHHEQRYIQNLEYWKSRSFFLEAISQNKLIDVFLQRYMTHSLKEEMPLWALMRTEDMEFDEDILYFCISGQVGLLMRWCNRGFEPPVEEMARKYMRLFSIPLIQTDKK